jgi:hypothetical protein
MKTLSILLEFMFDPTFSKYGLFTELPNSPSSSSPISDFEE